MTTFISIGNALQPFDRFAKIICQAKPFLPKPIFIQSGNTVFDCNEVTIEKYISLESFIKKIYYSNVVIMHAGAGSIIHALQCNKTPIVMPRKKKYNEHIDDHQVELAKALEKDKKIFLFEDLIQLNEIIKFKKQEKIDIKKDNNLIETLLLKILKSTYTT